MKKSTVIIIFIVYLASIVLIGFFGMKIKVYNKQKYVKEIEISVEAEKNEMFSLIYSGKDDKKTQENPSPTYNNVYTLTIYFKHALLDQDNDKYLPLTIIPKVTYTEGTVNSKGDTVVYSTNPEATELEDNGFFSLDKLGRLIIYKTRFSFDIYVNPLSISDIGTGAIIHVDIE